MHNNNIYLVMGTGQIISMTMSGEAQLGATNQTPAIYKMNLDGTNRTKLFECPSGVEIGTEFIYNGENIYTFFTRSKIQNTSENSHTTVESEKKLVKINLKTQKYETIFDTKNKTILRNIQK